RAACAPVPGESGGAGEALATTVDFFIGMLVEFERSFRQLRRREGWRFPGTAHELLLFLASGETPGTCLDIRDERMVLRPWGARHGRVELCRLKRRTRKRRRGQPVRRSRGNFSGG